MIEMKSTSLLFFFIIVFFSCQNKDFEEQKPRPIEIWSQIEMKVRDQEIYVYSFTDTAQLIQYNYKLISKEALMGDYELEKIDTTYFYLTWTERDSLFNYVFEAISNPSQTNVNCSEYIGNLDVSMINLNSSISCKYRSVCNWSEVSPNLSSLYKFMKRRIDISDN